MTAQQQAFKGQEISETIFLGFIFLRISALVSNIDQIKMIEAHFYTNCGVFNTIQVFLYDPF